MGTAVGDRAVTPECPPTSAPTRGSVRTGIMWRADAGYCVATTAEWGEHPDDVEYMRMLKAMPKKVLKKREMTVKDKDLAKACAKQGKVHFSICVWHLSEFSKSSGMGDEAASLAAVF